MFFHNCDSLFVKEKKKKGKYLMSRFCFSWCVCVRACVSIPADYPPPPPPVEESTGFLSSPGSFPPPPLGNSYDYQVRGAAVLLNFLGCQ